MEKPCLTGLWAASYHRAPRARQPSLTIDDIRRLAAEDLRAVDAVIRARLHSEVALVNQVSEYIIAAGGKRLRPLLGILASGACGARGAAVHELAAVIELIHTATLLHDDVVDDSELRRGRSTVAARVSPSDNTTGCQTLS